MDYTIKNFSNRDLSEVESFISHFFPYTQEKLGFDKPVSIIFKSDGSNAAKILGKTAYYDPENLKIVLYVDDRHPKDILRSLSHELVHHAQNCRGEFDHGVELGDGYAQNDSHMRKQEAEAYLLGNGFLFRDYEDAIKTGKIMIQENEQKETKETQKQEEPKKISDQQWKNQEIYRMLREKWIKKEKKDG